MLMSSDQGTTLGAMDELGICLAGTHRFWIVSSPLYALKSSPRRRKIAQKTELFCEQMLHLDLGAGGAYAASDLMQAFQNSPFQQQGAFIIVLPGRGSAERMEHGDRGF